MYKLGKFIGWLVNLALHVGIIYDGVWNFRHGHSFVLNIIAYVFVISVKEIIKALSFNAGATEYIAWHLTQQSEKANNKKDAINNIFNNITKDL